MAIRSLSRTERRVCRRRMCSGGQAEEYSTTRWPWCSSTALVSVRASSSGWRCGARSTTAAGVCRSVAGSARSGLVTAIAVGTSLPHSLRPPGAPGPRIGTALLGAVRSALYPQRYVPENTFWATRHHHHPVGKGRIPARRTSGEHPLPAGLLTGRWSGPRCTASAGAPEARIRTTPSPLPPHGGSRGSRTIRHVQEQADGKTSGRTHRHGPDLGRHPRGGHRPRIRGPPPASPAAHTAAVPAHAVTGYWQNFDNGATVQKLRTSTTPTTSSRSRSPRRPDARRRRLPPRSGRRLRLHRRIQGRHQGEAGGREVGDPLRRRREGRGVRQRRRLRQELRRLPQRPDGRLRLRRRRHRPGERPRGDVHDAGTEGRRMPRTATSW